MTLSKPVVDLTDKVVLVTGAGSGIGRAAAIKYAEAGAAVMCADIDGDGAKVTSETIQGAGGNAASLQIDVTDESAVEKGLQQTLDTLGGFDVLFNNAGIGDVDYQKTLDVNQNGVYYGLKHGSALLAERDRRNRFALFNPETNRVWLLLDRMVGADVGVAMRRTLIEQAPENGGVEYIKGHFR